MNDLQKKFAIIGSTAFIVWIFLAIGNEAFSSFQYGWDEFSTSAIYATFDCRDCANWFNALTFITWVGSLIAFNVYKD